MYEFGEVDWGYTIGTLDQITAQTADQIFEVAARHQRQFFLTPYHIKKKGFHCTTSLFIFCVYVCMCVYMWVYVFIYVCIYVCIYVRIYVYICVYVCVRLFFSGRSNQGVPRHSFSNFGPKYR